MLCGVVVLVAASHCSLLESLRERLRPTCLTLDVRALLNATEGTAEEDAASWEDIAASAGTIMTLYI